MIQRYAFATHALLAVALFAVLGHVCALPEHVHAATTASDHSPAAPLSDHEHSDGDAVHAASCEAVRSGTPSVATPTVGPGYTRIRAIDDGVDTRSRAAESTPPSSSPPLYLVHRTLLI
jgi:hypothetical protein